ncbi:extracellular solute-binding protein [Tenggerimyces flavus]|uniref:Extracellular solute-binding protein n=1 Tax=Tenggerimyces flavus TaxID=1708749 RepID=A0ABV7YMP7_9ACTN|nr:extracellular solute-binding protein [Tenggerimyces flavus]MBM7790424.1 multiple sugar transport system substrate-binding protein [Tenggerimyces flavus]
MQTFPKHGVSRRDLLGSAGLLALSGALVGCGVARSGFTGQPPAANVLTYWNLLGGGDGVRMKEMEAVYQKANPDVDLEAVTLTWGNPYYTKLSLATLGAQPPDVAISHLTRVSTLATAGLLQPFPPEALARHGMTPDKFVERAIQGGTIDGQIYAIPLDTHPFVMFYNTDICEKAGLLDSDGNLKDVDDPEAFIDAMAAAKGITKAWGGAMSTIADPATDWRCFFTLYSQLGGTLLTGSAPEQIVETDKAVEVLKYMRRLTVEEKVMPTDIDYGGAVALFANGRAAFYFEGEWEVSTFLTAKMPFSMQRYPLLFGEEYAVQADSHTFVLPGQAEIPDDRLDRTLGFIRSMLDQGLTWGGGGHIPTWLPVQESAEYKAIKPQSNYADVAESAVYDPPAWYSGSGSNFENIAGAVIGEVLTGRSQPEAAVTRMQIGISKLARTPSPL